MICSFFTKRSTGTDILLNNIRIKTTQIPDLGRIELKATRRNWLFNNAFYFYPCGKRPKEVIHKYGYIAKKIIGWPYIVQFILTASIGLVGVIGNNT